MYAVDVLHPSVETIISSGYIHLQVTEGPAGSGFNHRNIHSRVDFRTRQVVPRRLCRTTMAGPESESLWSNCFSLCKVAILRGLYTERSHPHITTCGGKQVHWGRERPPLCYTEGEVVPQAPSSLPLPFPGAEPQGLPAVRFWEEDVPLSVAVVGSRYGVKDGEWLVGSHAHHDAVMPWALFKKYNFLRIARHTTMLGWEQ